MRSYAHTMDLKSRFEGDHISSKDLAERPLSLESGHKEKVLLLTFFQRKVSRRKGRQIVRIDDLHDSMSP